MLDLYLLIVPIFAVLVLINLLVLKLAIKDTVTMTKIRHKSHVVSQLKVENEEQSPTKSILKYLLLHFTPLEICAVRRAKYKLCLLFSLTIIAIGTHFLPSPYYFVATGTIVYFTYFLLSMKLTFNSSTQNAEEGVTRSRQKYLQVLFTLVNIALNFVMVGLVYKNYQNSVLTTFLANAGLNIVFDNFVVRPTMTLILGIPLSLNGSFHQYVMECQREVQMLELYDTVGEKEMLTKPGKMMSPSKIAANIPLQVDIQKPDSKTYLKREQEEKPIEILKKIKRDKMLPPIHMNLQATVENEFSINSLFNSSKKYEQSDIQHSEQAKESHLQEKCSEQQEKISHEEPILTVKEKVGSENMLHVNPSQQEQIQNEEDIETEHITSKKVTEVEPENEEDFDAFRKRGATYNVGEASNEPLRISLNDSEIPTSRQEPLRICLNGDMNMVFQDRSDEDEDVDNYRRRKEMMTIDESLSKNPNFGMLEIKEKNRIHQSEEIEEIDLNSPEKRRRHGLHVEYEVESKMEVMSKKKKKKLSHDNPRIVRFSTGQPYLEYLPNMLSKDAKGKKSQAISRKQIVMDSRVVNSVKRPPKKKVFGEHNQNIVPEFKIEEL